jgi:hypothetical protein
MEYSDMHQCPICKQNILNTWTHCPYCSPTLVQDYNNIVKKKNRISLIIAVSVICFVILVSIISSSKNDNSTDETKPGVYNSSVDGSVYEVEQYLETNLKDPKSYDPINWSKVFDMGIGHATPHRFYVRHKYRARNSFNGYVIENQIFYLDDIGKVISVREAFE